MEKIHLAEEENEYKESAVLLTINEPWASLGRTFEYSYQKVKTPGSELYVYTEGSQVAGCILIEMHGALKGFIRAFCISEESRGTGIGKELLKYAEERIFKDTPNVFLFASSTNYGAIRFYENNGYERAGLLKDYNTKGADEILFRKTIGPYDSF